MTPLMQRVAAFLVTWAIVAAFLKYGLGLDSDGAVTAAGAVMGGLVVYMFAQFAPVDGEVATSVAVSKPLLGTLIVTGGPARGTRFGFHDRSQVVGRSGDSDYKIREDRTISSRHALFEHDNGEWYVTDLGSKSGTEIQGRRIAARTRLDRGATIRIGTSLLRMEEIS